MVYASWTCRVVTRPKCFPHGRSSNVCTTDWNWSLLQRANRWGHCSEHCYCWIKTGKWDITSYYSLLCLHSDPGDGGDSFLYQVKGQNCFRFHTSYCFLDFVSSVYPLNRKQLYDFQNFMAFFPSKFGHLCDRFYSEDTQSYNLNLAASIINKTTCLKLLNNKKHPNQTVVLF